MEENKEVNKQPVSPTTEYQKVKDESKNIPQQPRATLNIQATNEQLDKVDKTLELKQPTDIKPKRRIVVTVLLLLLFVTVCSIALYFGSWYLIYKKDLDFKPIGDDSPLINDVVY